MVKSMTAFAHHAEDEGGYRLEVDIKAVNHRYLDLNFRLPDPLRLFEPALRELCRDTLQRGKVEINVKLNPLETLHHQVLNPQMLHYWQEQLREHGGDMPAPLWADLLRLPDVVQDISPAPELLERLLLRSTQNALQALDEVRQREGNAINAVLEERLTEIETWLERIETHLPRIETQLRADMHKRLQELEEEIDEVRFEQEVLFWLNKIDVREEIDRLGFHIQSVRQAIIAPEPKGRHLDFLMQEFNREANTLASKSRSSLLTDAAIALKVVIEQMREQIQNVE